MATQPHGMSKISYAQGTCQYPLRPLHPSPITYNTAHTADGGFAHILTNTLHSPASGRILYRPEDIHNNVCLRFAAQGGDGVTGSAKLWIVKEIVPKPGVVEYQAAFACLLDLVAGAAALAAGTHLFGLNGRPHTMRWCDTITLNGTDYSMRPGIEINYESADGAAEVVIDDMGGLGLLIELTRSGKTAEALGVIGNAA